MPGTANARFVSSNGFANHCPILPGVGELVTRAKEENEYYINTELRSIASTPKLAVVLNGPAFLCYVFIFRQLISEWQIRTLLLRTPPTLPIMD